MPIARTMRNPAVVAAVAAMLVSPASADGGKPAETPKPRIAEKAPVEKLLPRSRSIPTPADIAPTSLHPSPRPASRGRRNGSTELDGQIQQRIADLEKAEAAAREWIAKRSELMNAARDDLVAIYAKMEPESAARQLAAPR